MFWRVVAVEQAKIFRRALLWIELAVLVLLVFGMYGLLFIAMQTGLATSTDGPGAVQAQLQQLLTWPEGPRTALSPAGGNGLGGLLVIVLAGAVAGQEYTWRTLHLAVSHGIPRGTLAAARWMALVLPALLFTLTPLLAGAVITAINTVASGGRLDWVGLNIGRLALSALATAVSLLPYLSLALMLAVLTRSTVAAIGAALGYALLVEGIALQLLQLLGGRLAQVAAYVPGGLAAGLLGAGSSLQVNGQALGPAYLAPGPALIGIALYTLGFLAVAAWVFRRQDLTG